MEKRINTVFGLYMKGDMMIEFNGYLTGVSQKFFCKRIVRLQQLWMGSSVMIAFFLIPAVMQMIFGDVDIIGNLRMIIILYAILFVITISLPNIQTKKEKEKITPQKVFIEDDTIVSRSNAVAERRCLKDVKEVRDYGEFYYFVFYLRGYSYRFVCQKNLLSKGTLEEFESLFEGKIKRMRPKSTKNAAPVPSSNEIKEECAKNETAAESGTIEFNGRLTGNTLKNYRKRAFKQNLFTYVFFLDCGLPCWFFICCFIMPVKYILCIVVPLLVALSVILPCLKSKLEKDKFVPKNITVKNGTITYVSDAVTQSIGTQQIKYVKDCDEYYELILAGFFKYSPAFICQKDLLSQGSLDEFEALFKGKIKKM